MDPVLLGALSIPFLLLLIAAGVHVGLALGLTGFLGIWLLSDRLPTALSVLTTTPFTTSAQFALAVVPLFVLMGAWVGEAGFAESAYRAAEKWMGRMPGGLALATVAANVVFGAASGSSAAACAVFTKFSLPEMRNHGYEKGFAAACIASSGVLAMLIPPSVLMIIYGILTEQSIGALFLAGVFPGLLLAALFSLTTYVMVRLRPHLAGGGMRQDIASTWRERLQATREVWGILMLAVLVLGGIYAGVFTPTEAGAAGAWGALVLMVVNRRFTLRRLWQSLLDTGGVVAMIFLILIGATVYSRFLALSRLPTTLVELVSGSGFPPLAILMAFVIVYLILGALLDSISMMTVTLPIVFPVSQALGFHPIWFAIVVIVAIELGLLTPPVGINVYVVKAASEGVVTTEEIFRSALPYYLSFLLCLALIIAFPAIATWLPSLR